MTLGCWLSSLPACTPTAEARSGAHPRTQQRGRARVRNQFSLKSHLSQSWGRRAQIFLLDLIPSVDLNQVLSLALLCKREEVKSVLAVSSVCSANSKLVTRFLDLLLSLLPASCPDPCLASAASGACPGPQLSFEKNAVPYRQNKSVIKQKGKAKKNQPGLCKSNHCLA